MGRLNLTASNPVKDAIDSYSALNSEFRAQDKVKTDAAKDKRDATTQGLQQDAARNQLTAQANEVVNQQLEGVRYKISTGVALTPEESALVQKVAPVDQGQAIASSDAAIPGLNVVSRVPQLKKSVQDIGGDISAVDTGVGPHKAKADKSVAALEARRQNITAGLTAVSRGEVPTLEQTQGMLKEVVANGAIADHDFGKQYKAITDMLTVAKQAGSINQPTKITDPKMLAAFSDASPTFASRSNLKDARVTSLYITPSPDGDPMKAQIIVGVSGDNGTGEIVDGVVTANRSSAPDDKVVRLSIGELSSQLQQKKLLLDGIKAAQIHYGNKTIMPLYEQEQKIKNVSKAFVVAAQGMAPGPARDEMLMAAQLTATGEMSPEHAATIATKAKQPEIAALAAQAANDQAIKMAGINNSSHEKISAATNETSRLNNADTNKTHLQTARITAAAAEKKRTAVEKLPDNIKQIAGARERTYTNRSTAYQKIRGTVDADITITATEKEKVLSQRLAADSNYKELTVKQDSYDAKLTAAGYDPDTLLPLPRGKERAIPVTPTPVPPVQSTGKGAAFANRYK
jgi:hypothetical protein